MLEAHSRIKSGIPKGQVQKTAYVQNTMTSSFGHHSHKNKTMSEKAQHVSFINKEESMMEGFTQETFFRNHNNQIISGSYVTRPQQDTTQNNLSDD